MTSFEPSQVNPYSPYNPFPEKSDLNPMPAKALTSESFNEAGSEESTKPSVSPKTPTSLAETSMKVKQLIFLILSESTFMTMQTIEINGTDCSYPTRAQKGYVKRSNGEWSPCTAIYKKCQPMTPKTFEKAFNPVKGMKTHEYDAIIDDSHSKSVDIENALVISHELFSIISLKKNYTELELEHVLKPIETDQAHWLHLQTLKDES